MSDSVRPQRWQPSRLPRPWDSPGKNTGVGCHFLPQCMKVKSESEVAQSCLSLCDPKDCSLPGSSVHGFSRQEYWSGVPLPSPMIMLLTTISLLFLSINICQCTYCVKNTVSGTWNLSVNRTDKTLSCWSLYSVRRLVNSKHNKWVNYIIY